MKLSANYMLDEFCITQHRGIKNTPPENLHSNLKRVAEASEEIDQILGFRSVTSSVYRSHALNELVGGSRTSRHCMGLARDFICPLFGRPIDICRKLLDSNIVYDQIIYEYTWVHFGLAPDGIKPRMTVMTCIGPNSYVKGLVERD